MATLIYLDTSVISAYFDDRTPLRRDETRRFWDFAKDFQYVISDLVISEIENTSQIDKRTQMLELARDLLVLPFNPTIYGLANEFATENLVPIKKFDDAQHLATAVVHGVDYLVSWNFRHMVNFKTIKKLPILAAKNGYFKPPAILTPEFFISTVGQEDNEL